jgi:hypothetical protein
MIITGDFPLFLVGINRFEQQNPDPQPGFFFGKILIEDPDLLMRQNFGFFNRD